MSDDEITQGQIVIKFYPREGGLERYIHENDACADMGPGETLELEEALRNEARAAWESAGLVEYPTEPEPAWAPVSSAVYSQMVERFTQAARLLHRMASADSEHGGSFAECQHSRCREVKELQS